MIALKRGHHANKHKVDAFGVMVLLMLKSLLKTRFKSLLTNERCFQMGIKAEQDNIGVDYGKG